MEGREPTPRHLAVCYLSNQAPPLSAMCVTAIVLARFHVPIILLSPENLTLMIGEFVKRA